MSEYPIYQIDAFTNRLFKGNPAAVCPLAEWPADEILQSIAAENNLSETAFFMPNGGDYELRWFTPMVEIDLCGHATLASAHVLFRHLGYKGERIAFHTKKAGTLYVARDGEWLTLDFPVRSPAPCALPPGAIEALGGPAPKECGVSRDFMFVYENEDVIRALQPDFRKLREVRQGGKQRYAIVTAPGKDCDFVSRFFCAGDGIDEDPVTGSAHCTLVPYWAAKLGKTEFLARQLSARGGELRCRLKGDRVLISGQAVTYMEGKIFVS
ncbi:MAG TPA: PhzF family phenazine biosynthesis protein [Alphaproteobacteria bacterium]|nr:PhzF family phenazine biosynthesis protein [Alphaproteobacteria bacterium]